MLQFVLFIKYKEKDYLFLQKFNWKYMSICNSKTNIYEILWTKHFIKYIGILKRIMLNLHFN